MHLLVGIVLINLFFTDNVSKYPPQETELAIVDQSLKNYQTLIKDLPKQITVILAGNSLVDLKTKLAKYSGLKRIHLLTHGSDGDLILAGSHQIERSDKNLKWVETGDVAAVGESSIEKDYTYTDTQPLSGENLYRLKMVDVDGSFAYSKIVSVHYQSKYLSVYPNPVSEKLFIKDGHTVNSVKLYTVNGILVFSAASFPKEGLDVRRLVNGAYFVNITDQSGNVETLKFVKD